MIDFTEVEVALNDPLRASLKARAKFGKSTVTLTVLLWCPFALNQTALTMCLLVATQQLSLDAIPGKADPASRSWIGVKVVADWHEKHKFLKCEPLSCTYLLWTQLLIAVSSQSVVLPVDIHSPYATYDTQFGLLDRPTHRNTTLEQAKFEVVAHRFVDLSENGYGVRFPDVDTRGNWIAECPRITFRWLWSVITSMGILWKATS